MKYKWPDCTNIQSNVQIQKPEAICSISTRYFNCLDYTYKDLWTMFIKSHPSHSDSFHGQENGTKWQFQHLPTGRHIELIVYLKICHWISKRMFYRTEILFFVLIPKFGCFRVMHVLRSMEPHPCPWEPYWCIRV